MASKMAPDLLNQISNVFSSDTVNQIASVFGETPARTQSAIGSLVPAILTTLARKASEASKEGGFLGFGGQLVSEEEAAAVEELANALGMSAKA